MRHPARTRVHLSFEPEVARNRQDKLDNRALLLAVHARDLPDRNVRPQAAPAHAVLPENALAGLGGLDLLASADLLSQIPQAKWD